MTAFSYDEAKAAVFEFLHSLPAQRLANLKRVD